LYYELSAVGKATRIENDCDHYNNEKTMQVKEENIKQHYWFIRFMGKPISPLTALQVNPCALANQNSVEKVTRTNYLYFPFTLLRSTGAPL